MRRTGGTIATALLVAGLGGRAAADVDFKFGGEVSSDIRYRLFGEPVDSTYPSQLTLLKYGFSRNDNLIKAKASMGIGTKVKAVVDADLVLYGFSDVHDLDALSLHERIDPYRLEVHAAYVDLYRVLPGLDFRVGRQVVQWGAADQFNPTSNVNTLDFSDALLFGRALANNMVRADYNPVGDWIFTAVWVPIFRPAEVPRTAPIYLHDISRPAPIVGVACDGVPSRPDGCGSIDSGPRDALYAIQGNPMVAPTQINVFTYQPETSLSNSQVALRGAGRIGGVDLSLSYYHGRFGIPVPVSTTLHLDRTADVGVTWPKMDVLGLDASGSIEKLAGLGWWVEAAVIFPQEMSYAIYQDRADGLVNDLRFNGSNLSLSQIDAQGRYVHAPVDPRGIVVPQTPFPKVTVGADLTIGSHLYVNLQYLHGFIDEFGAGVAVHAKVNPNDPNEVPRVDQRIGDYFVGGIDLHLFDEKLQLRLFAVLKIPSIDPATGTFESYKGTGVLFPQLTWSVWDGTQVLAGAFMFLGDRSTKFGDPSTGASEIFLKVRFTF